MFRNMGFNPYKLEHSSLDDVKNKFKELKQKRDELKEVPYAFSPRSFQSRLVTCLETPCIITSYLAA